MFLEVLPLVYIFFSKNLEYTKKKIYHKNLKFFNWFSPSLLDMTNIYII